MKNKTLIIILFFQILSSCTSGLYYEISLAKEDCLKYEELNISMINNAVPFEFKKPQLEISVHNTTHKRERIIFIKNLTDQSILMNSNLSIQNVKRSEFIVIPKEYLKCEEEKGYILIIKNYKNEYLIDLEMISEEELPPNEKLELKIKFDKPGIYRLITDFPNIKPGHDTIWGSNYLIVGHQSELFTID